MKLSRRHVLRGAGVALGLPFLESLAPRRARAQSAPRRRFVAVYFPLGTPDFWTPASTGTGDAWQLSPILEPLAPVKSHVSVLGQVDQTVYYPTGIEPSNGPLTVSYLTAVKAGRSSTGSAGISIDQRIAQLPAMAASLPSLQVGLSTLDSYCDGAPCSYSRSISWADATTPLYKLVNPQDVFDRIVSGSMTPSPAVTAQAKGRKSVLDFVVSEASSLEVKLGHSDRARMDQFLTSVRDLEHQIALGPMPAPSCPGMTRPTLSASVASVPPGYNRDDHADIMIDLIVMALRCDVTRVVSFMLDDARSEFVYDFVTARDFTATGSTSTGMPLGGTPIGFANTTRQSSGWATIGWWYASKMSLLCQKLLAIPDDGGNALLDNSVVWFGSGQIEEWDWKNLRVLYAGSGGGLLKVDQFVPFPATQSLSNVYLTFLREVFGFGMAVPDTGFGDSTGIIPQILA